MHINLYEWCRDKNITVHEMRERRGHLEFDRWLPPDFFFEEWMSVLEETFAYNFENQSDKISWRWGERGFHYQKVFMSILQMASLEPTLLTFGKRKYLTKSKFLRGCWRKMLSLLRIIW